MYNINYYTYYLLYLLGIDLWFDLCYNVCMINEIICLCGSTRFEKEFHAIARRLTLENKIVLTVHVFRHNESLNEEQLNILDELHLRKIDMADRVHIVNIDSYVGVGTIREMQYAAKLDKLITFEV